MFLGLTMMALMVTAEAGMPPVKAGEVQKMTNIETSYPFWSPDGSRIVFQSDRNGNSDIYTMKADGTDLKRLTDDPAVDQTPVWSPDGTRIVFQSLRDGNEEIYVMNADGSGVQTLVTSQPGEERAKPIWPRDGKKIIFTRTKDGNVEIFTLRITSAPPSASPYLHHRC